MALPGRDWIDERRSLGKFEHSVRKLRLLRDLMLVKPDPFEEKTEGGIYIPTERLQEQHSGVIIKIGKKVTGVKLGERILFNRHEGMVIELEGERLLMMKEEDIKAVAG